MRRAIKAAIAAGVDARSLDALGGDESRFASVWQVTGSVPGSFGQLNAAAMFTVLAEQRPRHIVEIGSYLGRSTVFFARSAQVLGVAAQVTAIDPHTGDRQQMENLGAERLPSFELFQAHIAAVGVGDIVTPIVERSSDAARGWTAPIDFLYVDGWHSFDAVVQDGRDWLQHLTTEGVVFFDDYARYEEVRRAVHRLADEGRFHLWGNAFGQALGGRRPAPGAAAATVLKIAARPLSRRMHRAR
jgi:predicted O-methyltransferase YrrM